MNYKIKPTIHTIDGYIVDPNSYGFWTRKNGYPITVEDYEKEKEKEEKKS